MSNRVFNNLSNPMGYYDFAPWHLILPGDGGFCWDFGDWNNMYTNTTMTTPITAVGQGIAAVRDKGPNNFHLRQATGSQRPLSAIQGGFKCANFNAASVHCMGPNIAGAALNTHHGFIVFEGDETAQFQRLLSASNPSAADSASTDGIAVTTGTTAAIFDSRANSSGMQVQVNGSGVSPLGIYEYEKNAALARCWYNDVGGSQDISAGVLAVGTGGVPCVGVQSVNNSLTATAAFDGRIWFMLHLGTIPSAVDIDRIQAWINTYRI